MSEHAGHDASSDEDPQRHWDERYGQKERIWSGRVNGQLAAIAESLAPGTALDLGCGEGGDAVWLAERGWRVVAVDVSGTALERARGEARRRGVEARVEFVRRDLSDDDVPDGPFDLVSAQYLHSFVRLDRVSILRRAADAIRSGGLLVIVDHGAPPPWASPEVHAHPFPSPEAVLGELDLPAASWERVRVETVGRQTVDPDGNPATIDDNVMVLGRIGAGADRVR